MRDVDPADEFTGQFPSHPDKARTVSRAAVALGAALLLFVPLGGALLLVAGSLGLVIAAEAPVTHKAEPAAITTATDLPQ